MVVGRFRRCREWSKFHFGLNAGSYWKGELPFPANRTTSKLRLSPFSFLIRAVLIGYVAYLAWRWFASLPGSSGASVGIDQGRQPNR